MYTHKHTHSLTQRITPYPLFPDRNHRGAKCDEKDFKQSRLPFREVNWLVRCQTDPTKSWIWGWTVRHTSTGLWEMPKHCCLAIRHWQISTSLIKTCTSQLENDTAERSPLWSEAVMSDQIRDFLLITALLVTEHFCTMGKIRFSSAAKLWFSTSNEWWPNTECFLSVTPPSSLAKCGHKQDRRNNDDRAS